MPLDASGALSLASARFDPARSFSSASSPTPSPLPLHAERYRFVPTSLPPPLQPRWIFFYTVQRHYAFQLLAAFLVLGFVSSAC
jgi:hypothetical protein